MLDKTKYARVSLFLGISVFYLAMTFSQNEMPSLSNEMDALEMSTPLWVKNSFTKEEVELGRKLVEEGALPNGKRVSAYFVCTDCHLAEKDKFLFNTNSAEDHLAYAKSKNLNYLPATSFYGMINQTEFYSGDYIKKYGDLVLKARNNLENAIQLCAQECSQGRELSPKEVKYTLAYLKSKELRLSDIFESSESLSQYQKADANKKRRLIDGNFNSKHDNNFGSTDLSVIKKLTGNAASGKYIFEKSCMTCHENERVSFYNINNSSISKKDLLKKLNNKENELLTILRYGTQPLPGSKAYMPLFTNEKLSDQHIADLIAYLNEK